MKHTCTSSSVDCCNTNMYRMNIITRLTQKSIPCSISLTDSVCLYLVSVNNKTQVIPLSSHKHSLIRNGNLLTRTCSSSITEKNI